MSHRSTQGEDDEPLLGTPPGDEAAPMRLRADPPQVTRLSRKVIGGLSLFAAVAVGGALIYSLQTRTAEPAIEELYSTQNRRTTDRLGSLPRDYSGPVLGPPLPGDLGRPILDAQDRGKLVTPEIRAARATDTVEQRRRTEEDDARTSRVFFQTEAHLAAPIGAAGGPGSQSLTGLGLPSQTGASTQQDRQLAFLNAGVDRRTVSPDRVMAPASPYVLQTGAVIPAALITGIRSDLPGQITAQVTEHVYDSPTGRILLVPQGSRLIGEYSNDVGFGQRRMLLVWKQLILPNSRSILLERQPAADAQGYAGLEDGVDYHWRDLARAAGLSTLLSIGAELAFDDQERLLRGIRNGAQDTINNGGQQIIQRQLNVPPTLTIRPGLPVRVIVTRDLVLEPYGEF